MINLALGVYFVRILLKALLVGQMSEDKPTPLLAMKTYSFVYHLFHTQSSFSAQYLFSACVTTSH